MSGQAREELGTDLSLDATPAAVMAFLQRTHDGLQLVEEPREAAALVRQADAIRYLAEKAGMSQAIQNQASEMGLRTRRRAGELLAKAELNQGTLARGNTLLPRDDAPRLADLGIAKIDSSRWQAVAAVPEARFEAHIAEELTAGRELTTAGVLRVARAVENQRRQAQVVDAGTPEGRYRCIVIDPPWPMQRIEREVRPNQSAELPYSTMTIDQIRELPVPGLADPSGCHVYLWVTHRFLPDGLRLLDAWGANYQCVMTWVKNVGFTPYSWMYSTEHILFARIGSLDLLVNGIRLDFAAPVTGHSRKPAAFYERVAHASPEPRLDMFARERHLGFVPWGNQVAELAE